MSGYIKYFENSRKNMSFVIKDDSVLVKYNEIWNKIKKTLNIKLLKNYSHHLRYFERLLSFVEVVFEKDKVNPSQNMAVSTTGAVHKNIKSKRKFCRQL